MRSKHWWSIELTQARYPPSLNVASFCFQLLNHTGHSGRSRSSFILVYQNWAPIEIYKASLPLIDFYLTFFFLTKILQLCHSTPLTNHMRACVHGRAVHSSLHAVSCPSDTLLQGCHLQQYIAESIHDPQHTSAQQEKSKWKAKSNRKMETSLSASLFKQLAWDLLDSQRISMTIRAHPVYCLRGIINRQCFSDTNLNQLNR